MQQALDEKSEIQVKMNLITESLESGRGKDAQASKLLALQLEEANGR